MSHISDKYDRQVETYLPEVEPATLANVVLDAEQTPALTLEHVKDQILRVGHTRDDDRIRRVITTARTMVESAYGITLHDASVTAHIDQPCVTMKLPRAGATTFEKYVLRRQGEVVEDVDYDPAAPGDFPLYLAGYLPQVAVRKGSAPIVALPYEEVFVTYKTTRTAFVGAPVEAWALTVAHVYNKKLSFVVGTVIGQMPDAAKEVMEAAGFVGVSFA